MSKKSKQTPPSSPTEPRRNRHLRQREARMQRWVTIGVGVAVGVVAVMVLGASLWGFVIQPRREASRQAALGAEPIAVVAGSPILTSEFWQRMRFEQDRLVGQINQYIQIGNQFASGGSNPFLSTIQQLAQSLNSAEGMSIQILESMIDEDVTRQLAPQYNVSVSDDEVQQEIEQQFGYERNPTPTPTPEPSATITDTATVEPPMTQEEFQQNFSDRVAEWEASDSLSESEFREYIRATLLREKLVDAAPLDVAETEEQVHARHILISIPAVTDTLTQEQAEAEALAKIEAIRKRIEDGEAFADVAKEVSEDTSNKDQGGDLGWFGRGNMVKEFEDAAFSLEPGQLSEPVKTSFGYHLILVEEKDPNRAVDPDELTSRKNEAFSTWFEEQKKAIEITRDWKAERVLPLPEDLRSFLNQVSALLAQPQPTSAVPEIQVTVAPDEGTPAPADAPPAAATPTP